MGRLEPENNPHLLLGAFAQPDRARVRGMKLVIVGGAPYADDYIRQVRRSADPRVVFPGYVFGRRYWELQRHASCSAPRPRLGHSSGDPRGDGGYSWDVVTAQYERLLSAVWQAHGPGRLPASVLDREPLTVR